MEEKIKELVEAALILGARRGNYYLTNESAKAIIESEINFLTNKFLELIDAENK